MDFLSLLSIQLGLAVHTTRLDSPEVDLGNPLIVLRAAYPVTKNSEVFYEHDSAAFITEEGYGFNKFGYMYKLK